MNLHKSIEKLLHFMHFILFDMNFNLPKNEAERPTGMQATKDEKGHKSHGKKCTFTFCLNHERRQVEVKQDLGEEL